MTSPLNQLLKKASTNQWTQRETEAVKSLKAATQLLPTLQIPSHGNRILQTDASDKYWFAVLLEELKGKRRLCGYRSGKFKESESHYHSTFKEILVVKNGIQKFEFHLIGHNFLVESDMSAFPQMLNLKKKTIPNAQLLRWSQWFSRYTFKHIKGKDNIIPDMLTRPPSHHPSSKIIPVIVMMNPSSPSSSSTPPNKLAKPPLQSKLENLPLNLIKDITFRTIQSRARTKLYQYQSLIIAKYADHAIRPIGIHPKNPFLHIFRIPYTLTFGFSKKVLPFLWYLCQLHTIIIEFPVPSLNIALHTKFADPNNTTHLHTFL